MQTLLRGSEAVDLADARRGGGHRRVRRTPVRLAHRWPSQADEGAMTRSLSQVSGLSRAQSGNRAVRWRHTRTDIGRMDVGRVARVDAAQRAGPGVRAPGPRRRTGTRLRVCRRGQANG